MSGLSQGPRPPQYKRALPPQMLFEKALRRDLFNTAGVVFATLFTIMVTTTLIRLLGRAAVNKVDSADLLPLIAFASVNVLPILLVLTLYVSVLLVLTRAYRDSEMMVWFASGLSLTAWIRPVLRFALPFVVVIGLVSLLVGPWANQQASEYRRRFEQREDVSMVQPGQFRESSSSNRVFFVESVSEDQTQVRNVFVTQFREGRLTVVASAGGRIETQQSGERFLVLENGRRWDGVWGGSAYRLMEFERYGVFLKPSPPLAPDERARAQPTSVLLADQSTAHLGELAWRLGMPISGLVVALLAIPLAFVNPRVGRSVNLIAAILIYVAYNNASGLFKAWASQGKVSFTVGLMATHLIVLALAAFLFWRRTSLVRLWPWGSITQGDRRHAASSDVASS